MKRADKTQVVEKLKDMFSRAQVVVLFDYKGTTVEEMNGLRRKLEKDVESDLLVFKNTLAKLAIADTDDKAFSEFLEGPNAGLFAYGEPVDAAKSLVDYAKDVKAIEVKTALMDGKILNADEVKALAKLPGREQLLSMFLGTLQAPAANFVSLLANVPRGLLNVLNGVKEQKEKQAA